MALAVVKRKTPHPCAGMTKAQRRDFERIGIGEHPLGGHKVLKALVDRGLIEKSSPKQVGRDALGPIMIPQWSIPIPVHMQWCKWCDENYPNAELE